jgi:hypothetical protein
MADGDGTAVRGDVPPSLHPDVVLPLAEALDREGTVGRAAYGAARAALEDMYGAYADIEDAERALRAAGRDAELAGAASRAFDRTAAAADRRIAEMRRHRAALAARVSDALADPRAAAPDGVALAQEVRAHLRGLPDAERVRFLHGAVEADDRRTVAAALAAPPYLSGITAQQAGAVRGLAAARWAPVDSAQAAAVDRAVERVMTASGSLVARYAKALERADGPRARASRALDRLAEGPRRG